MSRIDDVLAQIDLKNSADPNTTLVDGVEVANEVLYAQRMSQWLFKLNPQPSEMLQIAVRANHIQRWQMPRNTYPQTREGYLQWRTDLAAFHIQQTFDIMRSFGYGDEELSRLQQIMCKQHIKQDAECQQYEDVICLVFLEHYLQAFFEEKQVDEQKMITILRKTWFKMSADAQAEALKIDLPDGALGIVKKALRLD